MAKQVGYNHDFKSPEEAKDFFSEGPFVVVQVPMSGWRVEVELKDHQCPVCPDCSIFMLMEMHGKVLRNYSKEVAVEHCDFLNQKVREGIIYPSTSNVWVARL